MERAFGQMMEGFLAGVSEEDRKKLKACCETMASRCPCLGMKDAPGDALKTMMEGMKRFCGGAASDGRRGAEDSSGGRTP